MSTPPLLHPIAYEVDEPAERDRLSVAFRIVLFIPVAIVGCFVALGVVFAVIAAWFALLFTGRWPDGLHRFVSGGLRWVMRSDAYLALQTDRFPPLLSLGEHPEYPVRVHVEPPKPAYDRVKVGLRMFLAIPVAIVAGLLASVTRAAAVFAWVVIIFTGRCPDPIFRITRYCLAYQARAYGYFTLLAEEWPPLDESATRTLPPPAGTTPLTPSV